MASLLQRLGNASQVLDDVVVYVIGASMRYLYDTIFHGLFMRVLRMSLWFYEMLLSSPESPRALSLCKQQLGPSERTNKCAICWDDIGGDDATLKHIICSATWHEDCLLSWVDRCPLGISACLQCTRALSHSAETTQLLGLTWRTTRLEVFSNRLACFAITVSLWVLLSWWAMDLSTSPDHRYATLVSLMIRLHQLGLRMAICCQTVSAIVRVRRGWPEDPMYIILKLCIYLTLCGLTIPMAVIDWSHQYPRYLFLLRHAGLPINTLIFLAFTGAFVNDFDS